MLDGGTRAAGLSTMFRPGFRLAPLALAAMLLSAECHADWKVSPRIDLRESYSDNIGLQSDADARGGFVSEASPSVNIATNGPRLNLNAEAGWRTFAYSNKDAANLNNSERHYNANAQAKLIDELFYVDAGASGSRQAVSAFGQLGSNPYSSSNRTNISTWRISPYLRHRFGATADLTLRYMRDSVEGGTGGFGNSTASTRSADLSSGTAFTTLGGTLSYYHQDLKDGIAGESSSENTTAGLRWNVIRRLGLTGNVGYDKYEYPALGERTQGRSWSAGFIWTPSTRTHVQASFGRRYFGKTGSLASSYRTQRSVWSLDYSDAITTTRSQFLLPAAVDTAAMLDGLFAASFPDPAQRQQAVQAYIAATGLPPALANSINYLSNRYIRARRLQGAAIFRGARSNLTLTLFSDKRSAVSMQQSDSSLLGNQLATLNDDTAQRGASAYVDYRLSSRTNATATLTASRIRSLTTDIVNNNTEMRVGLSHRFAPKTQGSLDLRHSRGRADLIGGGDYHENAIVATFSVLY
jgi:uncharacterized protein (PEP-CTERM system associated)